MNLLRLTDKERETANRFACPSWLVWGTMIIVVMLFVVEVPLIFFFLNHDMVFRLQTANGSLVMIGALGWLAIMAFVFLWPVKRTNWYMVSKMEESSENTKKVMDRLGRMLDKLEGELESGKIKLEVENASRAVQDIRTALVKPIGKPPLPPEAKASRNYSNGSVEPVSSASSDSPPVEGSR